jgi:hypothetical protein
LTALFTGNVRIERSSKQKKWRDELRKERRKDIGVERNN